MIGRWRVGHLMGLVALAALDLASVRLVVEFWVSGRSPDESHEYAQLVAFMVLFATPFILAGARKGGDQARSSGRKSGSFQSRMAGSSRPCS